MNNAMVLLDRLKWQRTRGMRREIARGLETMALLAQVRASLELLLLYPAAHLLSR